MPTCSIIAAYLMVCTKLRLKSNKKNISGCTTRKFVEHYYFDDNISLFREKKMQSRNKIDTSFENFTLLPIHTN